MKEVQLGKGENGRQKICLLSTGPGKTLGDAALCEKLANSLLEKYDVEIDIGLYLIEETQKDKIIQTFKELQKKFPGRINLTLESGNLEYDHAGFDPNKYDRIIPFAAYNLFTEDFRFATQFFNDRPNVGLVKTNDVKSLISSEEFRKNHAAFNNKDKSLLTFLQEETSTGTNYFVHFIDENGNDIVTQVDKSEEESLTPYFTNLESNVYYGFDRNDVVNASEFDISNTTEPSRKVIKSKKPGHEAHEKSPYFNKAYKLQQFVLNFAKKHFNKTYDDKCIYLTRYDYFSDEYLSSLKENDLELLGIDNGRKQWFGEMFHGGRIQNIQSGFGKNKHGILLPNVPKAVTLDSTDAIKQNMQPEDTAIIDLIYGEKSKEDYQKNHELFFGYHNMIPNTDTSELPIKNFIKLCLDITSKTEGKSEANVDFILNIHPDNSDSSTTCQISEVLQGIDTNKYDVEYWKKNDQNQFDKISTVGSCDGSKPVVRLMNPFGVKANSFLTLLRVANPLTLQTGNSSIIEAFYLGKVPLYQLTSWSKDFLNALEQYVTDTLGPDSYYANIFRVANDPSISQDEKVNTISEIYRNHFEEIQIELGKLNDCFKNNMDLYKNFPALLKNEYNFPLKEKVKSPEDELKNNTDSIVPQKFLDRWKQVLKELSEYHESKKDTADELEFMKDATVDVKKDNVKTFLLSETKNQIDLNVLIFEALRKFQPRM